VLEAGMTKMSDQAQGMEGTASCSQATMRRAGKRDPPPYLEGISIITGFRSSYNQMSTQPNSNYLYTTYYECLNVPNA